MKFFRKPETKNGAERIKKFFAFLPVTIGNETRWLETVTVRQKFHKDYFDEIDQIVIDFWENIRFID